jgi:hypothetical protein
MPTLKNAKGKKTTPKSNLKNIKRQKNTFIAFE